MSAQSQVSAEMLKDIALEALDDLKAKDIVSLDVRRLTGVTDYMVIASGSSNRHVKALADNVELELKKRDIRPLGVEGQQNAEWVLVDFGDVVVHVMLPQTREFYDLERLWSLDPTAASDSAADSD